MHVQVICTVEDFELTVNFHPDEFTIHGEFDEGCRREDDDPSPKVLDADGVEIREGDTVWDSKGNGRIP